MIELSFTMPVFYFQFITSAIIIVHYPMQHPSLDFTPQPTNPLKNTQTTNLESKRMWTDSATYDEAQALPSVTNPIHGIFRQIEKAEQAQKMLQAKFSKVMEGIVKEIKQKEEINALLERDVKQLQEQLAQTKNDLGIISSYLKKKAKKAEGNSRKLITESVGSNKVIADSLGSTKQIADSMGSIKQVSDSMGSTKQISDSMGSTKQIADSVGSNGKSQKSTSEQMGSSQRSGKKLRPSPNRRSPGSKRFGLSPKMELFV